MAMTTTPRRAKKAGAEANGDDVLSPSSDAIRCIEAAVDELVERGVDRATISKVLTAIALAQGYSEGTA